MMNDEMLKIWVGRYNTLEREADRLMEKMEKHEAAGNADRAKHFLDRLNEVEAKAEGMVVALEIFGYTLQWQKDGFVVVEK